MSHFFEFIRYKFESLFTFCFANGRFHVQLFSSPQFQRFVNYRLKKLTFLNKIKTTNIFREYKLFFLISKIILMLFCLKCLQRLQWLDWVFLPQLYDIFCTKRHWPQWIICFRVFPLRNDHRRRRNFVSESRPSKNGVVSGSPNRKRNFKRPILPEQIKMKIY